jgi:CO dehydrogenase maturation factor
MGVLSREFLTRLSPLEDELVLVDMEAGIEHFGRGIETSMDSVLIVTEPSFDSMELTERISRLAAEVQVKRIWTVLNKVRSKHIALELTDQLGRRGVSVVGSIRYDPEVFQSGLQGHPIRGSKAQEDVGRILDRLL